jgi:hypothetical protein
MAELQMQVSGCRCAKVRCEVELNLGRGVRSP